jgi:orotate phosphoribosyltransferase
MMSLDRDLALAEDAVSVFVSSARRRAELRADLAAVSSGPGPSGAPAFVARPALLRRMAALLAELLPAEADRFLTAGTSADVAVATALALHTGLPLAVVEGRTITVGSVQPGETVLPVIPVIGPGDHLMRLVEAGRAAGATVNTALAVLDHTPAKTAESAAGITPLVLFTTD